LLPRTQGDPTPIPVAVKVAVTRNHLGEALALRWLLRDIRAHLRAEESLRQAERLAAIGQMVTGLTHESRNALQRSQACLELLTLEVREQPSALDLISRIQKAQDHLHQLFEDVREYAASIRLERRPCNLPDIWREAWSHLQAAWRGGAVCLR